MEDIRFATNKKTKKRIDYGKIAIFILKNWIKILLFILLILIMIFPTFFGHIIGTWLNDFVTSFLSKITF